MSQDDKPGLKTRYGINLENKHVVWIGSSDKIRLPDGRCIKDRCTIKIEYVMYVDSYELFNHGKPSIVTFSLPPYLGKEIDNLAEYFNIMHAASAERLYDILIYEFRKMDEAAREGKVTLRHSTGSIENENEKSRNVKG